MSFLVTVDDWIRQEAVRNVQARESREFGKMFLPSKTTWKICGAIMGMSIIIILTLLVLGLQIETAELLAALLVVSAFAWRLNFHRHAYQKQRSSLGKVDSDG